MATQITLKALEDTVQRSILIRIINAGGLLGMCADQYFEDETKGKLFIYECSEQCLTDYAKTIWDETLIEDILNFTKRNKIIKPTKTL